MKRKALMGLILTLSLNFVAFPAYAVTSKVVSATPVQSIVNNKIDFQVINEVDAPKALIEKLKDNKENRGFIYTVDDSTGYIYIAVMSGAKSTGGHSIQVTGIEDNEGRTNVFVKEVSPAKDSMVTQVITYPYTIVKARGITPNITVKNSKGEKFNSLNKTEFQVVSEVDAPKTLIEKLNKYKEDKGFISEVDESTGYTYIAVMSGAKPTRGFSIGVTDVTYNHGKTNILVKESSPEKNVMVAQVITYPYTIIKVKGITSNISVKNSQGEKFKYFNKENITNLHWSDLNKQTGVLENKEWTIKFNKAIKNLVLNNNTVYVLDSYGNRVDVNLRVSNDNTYVKVTPIANYENAQTYHLFISKNIDGDDNTKSNIAGYRMMFTIRPSITVE